MSEPNWVPLGGALGVVDYVGVYDGGASYLPGNVVRYAGVDWLAVNPSTGQTPGLASAIPMVPGMTLLADTILSAPAPEIVFTVPQDYAHLKIIGALRGDPATVHADLRLQCNGDTGANQYDAQVMAGVGTSFSAYEALAQPYISFVNVMAAASQAAGRLGIIDLTISDYRSAVASKQMTGTNGVPGTAAAQFVVRTLYGQWRGTSPITFLRFFPASGNFVAGSRLSLYGMGNQIQPPAGVLMPVGMGTTLPASPADGQEYILVDSLTAPTYAWRLRRTAGTWQFIGGRPKFLDTGIISVVVNAATQVGATGYYRSTATDFVVPVAGTYLVDATFIVDPNTAAGYAGVFPFAGAVTQGVGGEVQFATATAGYSMEVRTLAKVTATAGQTIGAAMSSNTPGTQRIRRQTVSIWADVL